MLASSHASPHFFFHFNLKGKVDTVLIFVLFGTIFWFLVIIQYASKQFFGLMVHSSGANYNQYS